PSALFGFSAATVCDERTKESLKSGVSNSSVPSFSMGPGVAGGLAPRVCVFRNRGIIRKRARAVKHKKKNVFVRRRRIVPRSFSVSRLAPLMAAQFLNADCDRESLLGT